MTPDELQRHAIRMYGRKHWRRDLALNLGLDTSTIWRISKRANVPAVVEVAIKGLLEKHKVLAQARKEEREREARANHRYKGKLTGKKRRVGNASRGQAIGGTDGAALEEAAVAATENVDG